MRNQEIAHRKAKIERTLYTDIKKQNMNVSKTYSNTTIPMLEICTTNNKLNSSRKPTGNIFPLLPTSNWKSETTGTQNWNNIVGMEMHTPLNSKSKIKRKTN